MKRLHRILPVLAVLLSPLASHAQLFRAYLSVNGSDSNPCTVAQPCRLLPAALAAVADGGEVWILDSANFNVGTVTITKSVSITSVPGQMGSVVAMAGAPAIDVAAPVRAKLRNISIVNNVSNPGTDGIVAGNSTLIVESVQISVPGTAINLQQGAAATIVDSVIRNSQNGVTVRGASAGIANTRFHDIDEWGVLAESSSKAAVSDSQFDDVAGAMKAHAQAIGETATVSAIRCSITNSSNGVASVVDVQGAVARMTIGSSLVSGVGVPFSQSGSGASTETLGDNISVNNGASSGTISTRTHF